MFAVIVPRSEPKRTALPFARLVPVITTAVPPALEPWLGENLRFNRWDWEFAGRENVSREWGDEKRVAAEC